MRKLLTAETTFFFIEPQNSNQILEQNFIKI
jgi:hypothetical protein